MPVQSVNIACTFITDILLTSAIQARADSE